MSCLTHNTSIVRLQLSATDDVELPEMQAVADIVLRNKNLMTDRAEHEKTLERRRLLELESLKKVRFRRQLPR